MKNLLILTGASGAGNSTASRVLEEKGYRVVENITPGVMQAYMDDLAAHPDAKQILAISPYDAAEIAKIARADDRFDTEIIGISCSPQELVTRFRVTHHIHPLQATEGISLEQSIDRDVEQMNSLRPVVDQFIDTTGLPTDDFRRILKLLFANDDKKLRVIFQSFAYKYGIPRDAEAVFDTRAIPNPYWNPELKNLNGLDERVIKFLDEKPETSLLLKYLEAFLDFYLEECTADQRASVNIAVGCTGGQHRAVFVVNKLLERYGKKYECIVVHRELASKKKDA